MKNLLLFTLISFTLAACGQTINGNGKIVTEQHNVDAFHSVSTSGVFELVLISGEPKVVVETDENIHDHIIIEVKAGVLSVSSGDKMLNADELIVTVYYDNINEISLSGASSLKTSGVLKSDRLVLDISGAAEADLSLDVDEFAVDLSGGGEVKLQGRADQLKLELSGAAEVEAFELDARIAEVGISGASEVDLSVSEELNVDISGAGEVNYKGNPEISQDISGAGKLKQIK